MRWLAMVVVAGCVVGTQSRGAPRAGEAVEGAGIEPMDWWLPPAAPTPWVEEAGVTSDSAVAAPLPGALRRVVYISPAIRRATPPPVAIQAEIESIVSKRPAFSTSSSGLRELPSPVENGGTMMRLMGRFRSSATAIVEGAECVPPAAGERPSSR